MSNFDISKPSIQDTLFDVIIDAGTDPETGLKVAVELDGTGAHIEARHNLKTDSTVPSIIGKISLGSL